MHLKLLQQQTSKKNLQLETHVATLEGNIHELRYQLWQKNIYVADLYKTYYVQKKDKKALTENNVLMLEQELMKIKNSRTTKKDSSSLEIEKLKESLKSSKILHKEQL